MTIKRGPGLILPDYYQGRKAFNEQVWIDDRLSRLRMHATFTPVTSGFRFYTEGTELSSLPIAAQNTNVTIGVNSGAELTDYRIQLRYQIDETAGADGLTTDDYQLQFSKNGGAFADVTNSSSGIFATGTGYLETASSITNRATNGITDPIGSFLSGVACVGTGLISNFQITAGNFTEHVFALTVDSAAVADGDFFDFRITLNGGTPGMTQNVTPRITVVKNASFREFKAYRFYQDGTESGSSPLAAQDTNITVDVSSGAQKVHLRIRIDETGGVSGQATDYYLLFYSVNATSGTRNLINFADTSSSLTNDGATTNRATNGITDPAGTFVAGIQDEDDGIVANFQLTANNFTEFVYAFSIPDTFNNNDQLNFGLERNGITKIVNPLWATITIQKTDTLFGQSVM